MEANDRARPRMSPDGPADRQRPSPSLRQEGDGLLGAARLFAEKVSGAKTDRAALARCLASLQAGDTLLVTKLDRLARSTRDLLNTLAVISEKGACFKSLGDGWAD